MPTYGLAPFLPTPILREAPSQKVFIPNQEIFTLVPVEKRDPEVQKKEHILPDQPLQGIRGALNDLFIKMPQTVVDGITGSSDFNFSDKMRLSKIPYYLGGLFLVSGFLAGGSRAEAGRQTAAVIFYLAAMGLTKIGVNATYKLAYNLDLSRRYMTQQGKTEKVFESADFPRFDLLEDKDYERYARGFGIPEDVNDLRGAVQERLKRAIVQSRTMKIVYGNLFATLGAAFLSRTDMWFRSFDHLAHIPNILKSPKLTANTKLRLSYSALQSALVDPIISKLKPRDMSRFQKFIIFGSILAASWGLINALKLKHSARKTNFVPKRIDEGLIFNNQAQQQVAMGEKQ